MISEETRRQKELMNNPKKKSPAKEYINNLNNTEAQREALNFLPKKVRYTVNKRQGVTLTKTWYKTTYVCEVCKNTVAFKWEATKNTDLHMICDTCKECVALAINIAPDLKDIIWAPKKEKNVIVENNKKNKKITNAILNMMDAGIIDKDLVIDAIVQKVCK